MKILCIICKILLAPVILALTLVVAIGRWLHNFSSLVLNIVAIILALFGIGVIVFLRAPFSEAWGLFLAAWLLSPYGIPLLARVLVELVDLAKDTLMSI